MEKKWMIIIGVVILIHLIVSLITIPYFPKINMEEPGYTASGYNLAIQGMKINEFFKDLDYSTGYKAHWDKIETFPPLYPYLLSSFIKIFSYNLVPLRYLSAIGGGILLLIFGLILRKTTKNYIVVFVLLLILELSYVFRFVAQQARPDIWVSVFSLITVFFLINYIDSGRNLYLFLSAITSPIAFLFHISGVIVLVAFYLTIFLYLLRKEISLKQLYVSISISFLVLLPYFYFIMSNFYYFKIQILSTYIGPATGFSWIFANKFRLLILIYLVVVGIMSSFLIKKDRLLGVVSLYYLCLLGIGLLLQIKIRYTLMLFPISLIILTIFLQYYLFKWNKIKSFYIILIFVFIVLSGHFILSAIKFSKKENSYWTIMEQIDEIVPEKARIIGHPDIQWGLRGKDITITECSDPGSLLSPFESYDFVIANGTWQKRMLAPCWTHEIMSKLSLLGSYKNEIYKYKIYKIKKTDVP